MKRGRHRAQPMSHPREITWVLHDQVLQVLGAMRLAPGTTGPAARQVAQEADKAIAALREVIARLWPPLLDDLGLEAALRQRAGESLAAGGPKVTLEILGREPPLGTLPGTAMDLCRGFDAMLQATQFAAVHVTVDLRRPGWATVRMGEAAPLEATPSGEPAKPRCLRVRWPKRPS